jgi:L-malate glycosyltransferase
MNIGISCYPTFGGSGVVASELGMELALQGHQVHIISYAPPVRIPSFHPNLHFHKVEVTDYPLFEYPPYSLALASRLVEVAQSEHLDLIHVHYAIPHAVSAYLAQEMLTQRRIPFITTLHGTDITLVGNAPSFWPITHFILEKSDAVTAVSQYLKDETCRVFKVDREIQVIPNFVPRQFLERMMKEGTDSFGCGDDPILVHVSNFRPVKRVLDVVEIFARVRQKRLAKLLMVGDGPDRGPAERRAEELEVHEDVYFLGMQSEIEEVLKMADLLLLPSQTESFGLVALEAMAAEVPVIATNVGGLPEVVDDGRTGFLMPVGDVTAMAGAALKILDNPDLHREMGQAAGRRARENFSANRITALYADLYARVLKA